MKTMCFDKSKADERLIFSDLYSWFQSCGEISKGISELRLVNKVLDKFEAVGEIRTDVMSDEHLRMIATLIQLGCVVELPKGCYLPNGDGTANISLEDVEWDRLNKDVSGTGFKNFGARRGLRALEFLEESTKKTSLKVVDAKD